MVTMDLKTLTKYAQGQFLGKEEEKIIRFSGITIDSREVREGFVFACIKGARTDGHEYAAQAASKGAVALICEKKPGDTHLPCILVPSTVVSLQNIARSILENSHVKVIGVSGSVGKTSTREMIAYVLSERYKVIKTEGNHNNEIGLPLTVFEINDDTEIAVLEMGIADFGQMSLLASIARPDVCVLTNIGDCHLENLGDRDGVLKAKTEMFDHLKPDAAVFLCGDDEKLFAIKDVHGIKPVCYGTLEHNDVRAENIEPMGFTGVKFTVVYGERRFDVSLNAPGVHSAVNALAAAAVGFLYGLSDEEIKKGLEEYEAVSGRFGIIRTNRHTLINDCYNANPMSMKAALGSLSKATGRRVAVLGDMGELGKNKTKLHAELGVFAAHKNIDALYCCGDLMGAAAEAALRDGLKETVYFKTRDELISRLPELVRDGDTILIKASHFMGFDAVLGFLTEYGGNKDPKNDTGDGHES